METIRYRCKKCGHTEPITFRDYIPWLFFIPLIAAGAAAITLFIAWNIGPDEFNPLEDMTGYRYTIQAQKDDLALREHLLDNIDFSLCGMEDGCYAKKIYNYMLGFDYTLTGNIYDPMYTFSTESGQCSNMAFAYCKAVYQFGVDCEVECGPRHCWSEVKLDTAEVLVDVTQMKFEPL